MSNTIFKDLDPTFFGSIFFNPNVPLFSVQICPPLHQDCPPHLLTTWSQSLSGPVTVAMTHDAWCGKQNSELTAEDRTDFLSWVKLRLRLCWGCDNYGLTKSSELVFKYLDPQISLKNGSVLKTVSKETDPNHWSFLLFWKIQQKPRCDLFKCFKKIAPWFLPDCSRNQKPQWSECVSFETWYPKVRFEYWTIFEGYLQAEILEKQLWTSGQSLIFIVFSYI